MASALGTTTSSSWVIAICPCCFRAPFSLPSWPDSALGPPPLRPFSPSSRLRFLSPVSRYSFMVSVVICSTMLKGVGSGRPALNSWAMMLMPLGGSLTLCLRCTPKASRMDPAICLYLATSISEKESSSTKKHISSDIRSAKVMTQAGAPASCFFSGGASSSMGMCAGPRPQPQAASSFRPSRLLGGR